jgi:hypothetical protein
LTLSAALWLNDAKLAQACDLASAAVSTRTRGERGQYGGDMRFLAGAYTPPGEAGESNHFIDLWAGQELHAIAQRGGLTNNRALFVNSHGGSVVTLLGNRYAFHPHDSLVPPGQKLPRYSVADLARVIGPAGAADIHNIVIAGCNADGSLRVSELRRHFVNATNITHMPAGALGYQPMLIQSLLSRSDQIQTLFETPLVAGPGLIEYLLANEPAPRATRFAPYVAELFRPGEKQPYRIQIAGREILEPTGLPVREANLALLFSSDEQ